MPIGPVVAGPVGLKFGAAGWAACALAVAALSVVPASRLWSAQAWHTSPLGRRIAVLAATRRASVAFTQARAAVAATVGASTSGARRSARAQVAVEGAEFSRDMESGAALSSVDQQRLLDLKSRGETILEHHCRAWTSSDAPFNARGAALESRLHYFTDCTAAAAAFQQTLDDEVAILVKTMTNTDRREAA